MFGIGFQELIILAVIVFIVVGGGLVRRGGGGIRITGPTLVLRRFKIDEAPLANILVEIVGRASGVTAWLLTVIGFDAETSLKVTDKEITFRSSSLFGQTYQVLPLQSVSSTHCGYSKPIGYFIMGAIFLIGGLLSWLGQRGGNTIILPGLVIGGIFLTAYYLSKKIVISLETNGGMVLGLSFKRSVIENVSIDIEQALKVIRILNQKVIESQNIINSKVDQDRTNSDERYGKTVHEFKTSSVIHKKCPKCGKEYASNSFGKFCEECGMNL